MILSVITINRNNADGLRRTLESVAAQTFCEFEHIIVDGGSSDDSVPIIKSYEESIISSRSNRQIVYPGITWVCEKDDGIYDAMNKGVRMATGDYVYFLNSGDELYSIDSLEQIVAAIDGSDIIAGRVDSIYNGGSIGISPLHKEDDYSLFQMYLHGINHQAVLIRRELQLQYPYDTESKIGGDWKFFIQTIVLKNASVQNVNVIFAKYDRGGVSSNRRALVEERLSILRDLLPKRIADDYLKVLPHYYEVIRVEWLLHHPFWYRVYRAWTTFGRKIFN